MLQILVPITPEGFDEKTQTFVDPVYYPLQLEHSLVSLSKWESKWHKSFLSNPNKTDEEIMDYIRCMTITQNVKPEIYEKLSVDNIKQINAYLENSMTATYFSEDKSKKGSQRESVTSELIYYWMIALNIPFKCEKWHLNRLLTLIRVCNLKNTPPKKRSKKDILSRNAALNQARRQQLNTKG